MAKTNQIQKVPTQKDITDLVMVRVNQLKETGGLSVPKDYAIQNELKLAYFSLLETVDRNKRPALEVCTLESVSNGLLKMVINGLSVAKSQGYFIVYGNSLDFTPSYFGNITIALRGGIVTEIPKAQVIYEGDEFQYEIKNGDVTILSHIQQFKNINVNKIIGAYAIVPTVNGDHVELMTMEQIKASWSMGNAKGRSTAHSGFPDQMAKRTVINLALKYFNKSQDDAHLFLDNGTENKEKEVIDLESDKNKRVIGYTEPEYAYYKEEIDIKKSGEPIDISDEPSMAQDDNETEYKDNTTEVDYEESNKAEELKETEEDDCPF